MAEGANAATAREAFQKLDADGDGRLSLKEFAYRPEDEAFWEADRNGDGRLSHAELESSKFGRSLPDIPLGFEAMDRNHDHVISLSEFRDRPRN